MQGNNPGDQEHIDELRQAMYSRTLSEQLKPRERRALDLTRAPIGEDWKHEEDSLDPTMVAPRTDSRNARSVSTASRWGQYRSSNRPILRESLSALSWPAKSRWGMNEDTLPSSRAQAISHTA